MPLLDKPTIPPVMCATIEGVNRVALSSIIDVYEDEELKDTDFGILLNTLEDSFACQPIFTKYTFEEAKELSESNFVLSVFANANISVSEITENEEDIKKFFCRLNCAIFHMLRPLMYSQYIMYRLDKAVNDMKEDAANE